MASPVDGSLAQYSRPSIDHDTKSLSIAASAPQLRASIGDESPSTLPSLPPMYVFGESASTRLLPAALITYNASTSVNNTQNTNASTTISSPQTSNSSFSTFHPFLDLPFELHAIIWKCATQVKRRVVMMSSSTGPIPVTFRSNSQTPSILHATKESRKIGLETYEVIIQDSRDPPVRKYVNYNTDIVVFPDLMSSNSTFERNSLASQWKLMLNKIKIIELNTTYLDVDHSFLSFCVFTLNLRNVLAISGLKNLRELQLNSVWYSMSAASRATQTFGRTELDERCKLYMIKQFATIFTKVEGYKVPEITFLDPNNA
ncbi:hypothetical protein VTL71DRAFT_15806 [Oculimacula yallundae]|uniref:2EXR domain-containing protein n=1 Tax=Oculimacula yallundae TaxID=86028 RepID=A0ABR4CCQ2_9HELO